MARLRHVARFSIRTGHQCHFRPSVHSFTVTDTLCGARAGASARTLYPKRKVALDAPARLIQRVAIRLGFHVLTDPARMMWQLAHGPLIFPHLRVRGAGELPNGWIGVGLTVCAQGGSVADTERRPVGHYLLVQCLDSRQDCQSPHAASLNRRGRAWCIGEIIPGVLQANFTIVAKARNGDHANISAT